jgi:K+-transporting ATPase ATPase A chain
MGAVTTGVLGRRRQRHARQLHAARRPRADVLIQLGEVLPAASARALRHAGLRHLAVFVAGLMVGRTPEYLGKKIEAREMKLAMLRCWSCRSASSASRPRRRCCPRARLGRQRRDRTACRKSSTPTPRRPGNNGSAFAGFNANTPWYNTTSGIAMLLGRFAYIVPVMAIAGSLAAKTRAAPPPAPSRPTRPLFVGLLIGVILILGGCSSSPPSPSARSSSTVLMLAGRPSEVPP